MAWHRHTSPTNFIIQQSRSFEGICVPLRLMNCLFPVPDSQRTATELFQSPLYGSGTVFGSISHLLRHFPSVFCCHLKTYFFELCYRNYCCRAREVTLSFMDTLIALIYLLTYLCENHPLAPNNFCRMALGHGRHHLSVTSWGVRSFAPRQVSPRSPAPESNAYPVNCP